MSNLDTAISLAVHYHEGQVDKSGRPYILHPLRVMMQLDGDDEAMMAAVMHDLLEDTELDAFQLADYGFSDEVHNAVVALTRPGKDAPDRPTHREYIRALKDNPLARKVKIADLFDNMNLRRMKNLDANTGVRLMKRYTWAMNELLDQEALASLPNETMDMRKLLKVVEDKNED